MWAFLPAETRELWVSFSVQLIGNPAFTPWEQETVCRGRATNATHLISLQISSSLVINCILKEQNVNTPLTHCQLLLNHRLPDVFCSTGGESNALEGVTKALIVSLCSWDTLWKMHPDKVFLLRVINSVSFYQPRRRGGGKIWGKTPSHLSPPCSLIRRNKFLSHPRNVDKEKTTISEQDKYSFPWLCTVVNNYRHLVCDHCEISKHFNQNNYLFMFLIS